MLTSLRDLNYPVDPKAPGAKKLYSLLCLPCCASIITAQAAIAFCASALAYVLDAIGGAAFLALASAATSLGVTMASPIGGKLSDLIGRKKTIIISLMPYVICLLICFFSTNAYLFLVFYLLSSVFLGNVSGVYSLMMMDVFQGEQRASAMGLIAPFSTIAALGATYAGGAIVDHLNPKLTFLFLASFAVLNILLVVFLFPDLNFRKGDRKPFDFFGTITLWLFILPACLVLSSGGKLIAWNSPLIPILSVVAVISFVAFLKVEHKAADPVVDPKIFQIPGFTAISILCACNYIMNACNTYLNIFSKGLGFSGSQLAIVNLLTLSNLIIGPACGKWMGKTRNYKGAMLLSACFGTVFCIVGIVFANSSIPLWMLMIIRLLSACSSTIFLAGANCYRSDIVPKKDRGTAQGGYYMIYNMTNVIFSSIFGLIMNNVSGGILTAFPIILAVGIIPNLVRLFVTSKYIPRNVTPVD